jgi:hypothetical protein
MDPEKVEAMRSALKDVFNELNDAGFLADGPFTCCNSCGHYGMKAIANQLKADGRPPKGYVFWHGQDDDSLREHGAFCLRFGGAAVLQYREAIADEEVARAAIAMMEKHGLGTEWNGDVCTAIAVNGLRQR